MKPKSKLIAALAALFFILTGAAAAAYQIQLDTAVPVTGSSLTVTVLNQSGSPQHGIFVQFVLNSGIPVLNITDSQGKARFIPLLEGSLNIYATTMDGVQLANVTAKVQPPTSTAPQGGSSGGTYPSGYTSTGTAKATATVVKTATGTPVVENTVVPGTPRTPVKHVENEATTKATATPVSTAKTPGFGAIIAVFAIAMIASLLKNNRNRR